MPLYPGFPGDIKTFTAWAVALAERGSLGFYSSVPADYLPGYLYVLWGIGLLQRVVHMNAIALLVVLKMPAVLADALSALILYRMARDFTSERIAILSAGAYLFNPGIIFNSAIWGQVDSVAACLALLATFLLVRGGVAASAAVFAAAFLVKPQVAPVGLMLGVFLVRRFATAAANPSSSRQVCWDTVAAAGFAGAAVITVAIVPFRLTWLGLARHVFGAVSKTPFSSVNAFNLWGAVQGFYQPEGMRTLGLPAFAWGGLLLTLSLLGLMVTLWKRPHVRTLLLVSGTALAASFLFPTRIHERYFLPALAFLAVAPALDRRTIGPYLIFSITFLLNLVHIYRNVYLHTLFMPSWMEGVLFVNIGTRLLGAINLVTFAWLAWIVVHQVPGMMGQPADRRLSSTDHDGAHLNVPMQRPAFPRWLTWTVVTSLSLLWCVYFEFPSVVAWRLEHTSPLSGNGASSLVEVSGSPGVLSGRLDRVNIRMGGAKVGDLPADEISLHLHNVVLDVPRLLVRKELVVSRMGTGDGIIVLSKENLQDFLASVWGVQNMVVTLENDMVIIEGDARALALGQRSLGPRDPLAPPSARLEGRLMVSSPTTIGLQVQTLTLRGLVAPLDIRNALVSRLNPLITLRGLPVLARIRSVAVREGTVRLILQVGPP